MKLAKEKKYDFLAFLASWRDFKYIGKVDRNLERFFRFFLSQKYAPLLKESDEGISISEL